MADKQLANVAGLNGEPWGSVFAEEQFLYDPTATSQQLTNGMTVIIYGGYTPSTNTVSTTVVSATAIPVIRIAPTTPPYTIIGVVIHAPTAGYSPGQVVDVCVRGVTQVLCDANNTTYGHLLIGGSTTAGAATDASSPTAGKTIAVCLQSATISSGTALVYARIGLE